MGAKLFPRAVRQDVLRLYSFLRVADDYVDAQPPQPKKFYALRKAWDAAKGDPRFDATAEPGDTVDERVIKNITGLSRQYAFDAAWVESFWDAMESDLARQQCRTLDDSLAYVYGSAEVVGLMMAKLMGLPPAAYETAKLQGRAMQWINFIRDLAEDNALQRRYFPLDDLKKFGLKDLSEQTARADRRAFNSFMRYEITRYRQWQAAARKGLVHMPGMLRPGLATAARMYDWTAAQIAADPLVVFEKKVKPSKGKIVAHALIAIASHPKLNILI